MGTLSFFYHLPAYKWEQAFIASNQTRCLFFICVDPLKLFPISPILLPRPVPVLVCVWNHAGVMMMTMRMMAQRLNIIYKQQMLPAQQHLGSQDIFSKYSSGRGVVAAPLLLFCGLGWVYYNCDDDDAGGIFSRHSR